jgi:hypothetical protein
LNLKALQSLRDEMELQRILHKQSWVAVHSHHFLDVKENVWRELDALASRTWKGVLNKRPILVKVLVLAESKRIAEKQVLLPAFKPLKQAIIFDWLGAQRHSNDRAAIYQQVGVDARIAQRVDLDVAGGAWDFMPDAPNLLRPPKDVEWNAAGLTEAQNGSGKVEDGGSSVIWKTRLDLQSAARALAQREIEFSKQELILALQFARLKQMASRSSDFDLYEAIAAEMRDRAFTITVIHPMIVVDADLWGVTETDVVPVQHARIHLTGVSRFPYYWFDLVRRDAAERAMSEAQAGYDRQAAQRGLVPQTENMGVSDYEIAAP